MAIVYRAQISPTKNELAQQWIAEQPWFTGDASTVERVAALRWDDPAGEVGLEILIVRDSAGAFYAAPFTYRGEEFPEGTLVTTMTHSVLGDRWIYEGLSDPVFLEAARTAVRTGVPQADLEVHQGNEVSSAPLSVSAETVGSIQADDDAAQPAVVVNVTLDSAVEGEAGIRGTWEGQESPVFIVTVG